MVIRRNLRSVRGFGRLRVPGGVVCVEGVVPGNL